MTLWRTNKCEQQKINKCSLNSHHPNGSCYHCSFVKKIFQWIVIFFLSYHKISHPYLFVVSSKDCCQEKYYKNRIFSNSSWVERILRLLANGIWNDICQRYNNTIILGNTIVAVVKYRFNLLFDRRKNKNMSWRYTISHFRRTKTIFSQPSVRIWPITTYRSL